MTGRIWRRLSVVGLAAVTAVVGVVPGTTQVAQAVVEADRVQTIDTSAWSPNAPGPSGVAYRPSTDTLLVVDGDKNNEGSPINLWEFDPSTETVVYSAALELGEDGDDDATGVTLGSDGTLYVSTDGDGAIYMFEPDGDDRYGGTPVGFINTGALTGIAGPDTEDPAFDASTGHLFFLNGNTAQVFEINPMAGGFGDGDDVLVIPGGFVIPPADPLDPEEKPEDWEGMAFDIDTNRLLVAAKDEAPVIHEITKTGDFFEVIDVAVIGSELPTPPLTMAGLTVHPGNGADIPKTYWIADRANASPAQTNDGRLHRIHMGPLTIPTAPPVLAPIGNKSGAEGSLITFDAGATDSFGDTLSFSLVGAPTGAEINSLTGVFRWTPTETQGPQVHTLTVRVTDSGGLMDNEPISISVSEVNRNPVVTANPDLLRAEGESVLISMFATDPDIPAQTVNWSATGLPAGLSINASNGRITGIIGIGTTSGSPYSVTVTARDSGSPQLTGTDTFLFSVTDTNRSPIMSAIGNKTVTQGSTLMFKANATDPDGDGFTFSLVSPPAGASISSAGNFTWTPSVAPGNYPVTVRVVDNGTPALTDQETITITVQAGNPNPDPVDPFTDDDGHVFENSIEWLAAEGITQGCNPPTNDRFCPNSNVTRGQMATFLVRALSLPTYNGPDRFVDDNGNIFEGAIERLAQAAITVGCNPPSNTRFCPDDNVTRGQMAAFLVRAFDLPAYSGPDRFVDDNGNVFEGAIERLAQAGITVGCNPPANDRFCPGDNVTRGQMAAFLKRALGG